MNGKTIVTLVVVVMVGITTAIGVFIHDAGIELPFLTSEPKEEVTTPKDKDDATSANAQPTDPVEKPEPKLSEEERLTQAFAQEKAERFSLLLCNKEQKLPADFEVETEEVQGSYRLDARIADIASLMIDDAASEGIDLLVCSAYRSAEKQTTLFNNMVADYINQGKSEAEAKELTAIAIAEPGTSEHQTGLAADIVTPSHQTLDPAFAETPAGKWLLDNAWKYGFILRYPEDKVDITGYMYESWHFRYVGPLHAKLIKDKGMCLEEYLAQTLPEGYTDDPEVIQALAAEGAVFLEDDPVVAALGTDTESKPKATQAEAKEAKEEKKEETEKITETPTTPDTDANADTATTLSEEQTTPSAESSDDEEILVNDFGEEELPD